MKRFHLIARNACVSTKRLRLDIITQQLRSFSSRSQPLRPFEIEQYDGWHVPTAAPGLSDSDCEPLKMAELLSMADEDCKQQWEELCLGYPPRVYGDVRLRQEIMRLLYPLHGSGDSINCMVPQEGIFCGLQALLEPGDAVIVAAPCYQSLNEIPRSLGCRIQHWHPDMVSVGGTSFFRFDPKKLEGLMEKQAYQTRAVVVNFPHNPTRALPTLGEWQEIIQLCDQHGVYVFCDEMYRGLEQPGVDRWLDCSAG